MQGNSSDNAGVVIVGAGHAGGLTAGTLRDLGYSDPVTLIGDEPVPPYERPPLSKQYLDGSFPFERLLLRPESFYREQGIALQLKDRACAIDRLRRRVTLSSGKTVGYDTLVIATGSRPRPLPVPTGGAPLHYLRDAVDARELAVGLAGGRHITVIGAGFIGLEIAATAHARGCRVTLLEAAPRPLARGVIPEISDYFAGLHREKGIELRVSTTVEVVDIVDGRPRIQTSDGKGIDCDTVLVAIGVEPNDELARGCGLDVRNGIVTDEFGRTNDPAILAVGDVACRFDPLVERHLRLESWQNAQDQAIVAARTITGNTATQALVPWFWSDQFDTNLQVVGAPKQWDRVIWRASPPATSFVAIQVHGNRIVGALGVNSGREIRSIRRLLAQNVRIDPHMLTRTDIRIEEACL